MKRYIIFLAIGIVTNLNHLARAEDRTWSSGEMTPTLDRGQIGSEFRFEALRYQKTHSPEYSAEAVLHLGLLSGWHLSIELRQDELFFKNSFALLTQYQFLHALNNPLRLSGALALKYRFFMDRGETSAKLMFATQLFKDRLTLTLNVFAENLSNPHHSVGLAQQILLMINQKISAGVEHQDRLMNEANSPEWLFGPLLQFKFKTEAVPIYYMVKGKKVLKATRSIHGVSLDLKALRGFTREAPAWLLTIGISLAL